MKSRFGGVSMTLGTCFALCVSTLLGAMPRAAAADPVSVAYVSLGNCGQVTDQGPTAAAASNSGGSYTTGLCTPPTGALASGGASFSTGYMTLNMNSGNVAGIGVDGVAYLDDLLTFHVNGGGTAVVNVSMGGDWGGTFDDAKNASFQVEFGLGTGPTLYTGRGYSNLAYHDGNPGSDAFNATCVACTAGHGTIVGSYLFNTNWTIRDGVQYEFYVGIKNQAGNGATSYMTDPLFITLPAGVSYTSVSGRDYAPVPEPSTVLLLGCGLAAVARRFFAEMGVTG